MRKLKLRIIAGAVICLAVIAFLAFPVGTPLREHPGAPLSLNHFHQLYVALKIYEADEGAFPQMNSSSDVRRAFYPNEIKDESVLVNPANHKPLLPNPWLSGKQTKDIEAEANRIVAFYVEDEHSPDVVDVVFLSGTAMKLDANGWQSAKAASRIP